MAAEYDKDTVTTFNNGDSNISCCGVKLRHENHSIQAPPRGKIGYIQQSLFASGNLVYVKGITNEPQLCIYRHDSVDKISGPSEDINTRLVSIKDGLVIYYNNDNTWGDNKYLCMYPIEDEYILRQIGEVEKLLAYVI